MKILKALAESLLRIPIRMLKWIGKNINNFIDNY